MIVNLISDAPNSGIWSLNNQPIDTLFESKTIQLVQQDLKYFVYKKNQQLLYNVDLSTKDKLLINLATLQ